MTDQAHSAISVGIDSEIGPLREVMVHRPGHELDRLTPTNASELLFDGVLWSSKARLEHDAFTEALRQHGVSVRYFGEMLAQAIAAPGGREFVTSRTCTPERFGAGLARDLTRLFADTDPVVLAGYLIGGVTKSELGISSGAQIWQTQTWRTLTWQTLADDDFVLAPLPNTMYQRDNAAWIGSGLSINSMAKPARRRESVNTATVYKFHPLLRDGDYFIYSDGDDLDRTGATLEGGDLAVVAPGVVLAGLSERTTSMGVEILAGLFETGQAHRVVAIELPRTRSQMHLDTVLTMVDLGTFVAYPYLDWDGVRCWQLTPRAGQPGELDVAEHRGLYRAIGAALAGPQPGALGPAGVRILMAQEDARSAEREQWDDADNYLAIAPGVVMGYDRNVVTNAMLSSNGIEVIALDGSELGRSGGSHCLSCPLRRDPVHRT